LFAEVLEGGTRVSYGARAIVKGGLAALPELAVPGGLLIGDDAGFLNMTKIKGSHTAMKSGMLAAEAVAEALAGGSEGGSEGGKVLTSFREKFEQSWLFEELSAARNSQQAIHKFGTLPGAAFIWVDQLFRGNLPFTLKDPTPDHATLKPAASSKQIDYPKPDGKLSFDKLSSVFLSNTNHEEDQPCHLRLADPDLPVHCKTCDIKDPAQNITWVVPEGTGGPNYPNM
jgi:electron-transferring-flavoprotein dehydrogenase